MRKILSALLVLVWGFPSLCALGSEPVVSVNVIPPAEPLKAGSPVRFSVELSVSEPYHINSNQPLEDYLIPTSLEFEPRQDLKIGSVIFPTAEIKKLPISESPMAVFEGIVKIAVEVIPSPGINPQDIVLQGKVRYQACDDSTCLSPVSQSITLKLTSGGSVAPQAKSESVGVSTGSGMLVNFGDKGLLASLLLVFVGGLALNLTPCVYPMIPITIAYFGGQAEGKKGSLILHSVLYTMGMAVTYSILGVIAALTGGLLGSALQIPAVLIGIALIMVLLALSMFDVYELKMPSFLNRLAGSSQKGFAGTLLMGLTVGIVAAPCIGPFVLGLLTYVGNKGSAALGFLLFFVLSLGLGFPFLILGVFSGSIRRLPRSGSWMVWVRKVFGFILVAMAVFFLKTLFPSQLAYQLTFALVMLLAGIYLAWIDPATVEGKIFPCVRNAVGIGFFAVALYAAVSGVQAHVQSTLLSEARPRTSGHNPDTTNAIKWISFSEEALSRASQEARPAFIDFYADWCAPCKELDTQTFAAPEVVSLSKQFVMIKVDLTSADDPQAEALRKKFQVRGVPTLVFLKPDSQEIPSLRGTGFESKESFLAKMRQALQLSGGQSLMRQELTR